MRWRSAAPSRARCWRCSRCTPIEPVSAERLAVALWGEDAPPSAVKTVQVYVARLRKALDDPDVLVTTPAGYRLRVRAGELDAERFERQVADGRDALAAGRGEQAAAELREALELWRGPPLAELASAPFAPAEIARLEEQQLAAVEVRVEADLAAGRHAELVGELQQLTSQHPWRERLHAQLMLALYRSGRQADALEAYRHAREVLVEQLGIEPGAELHDLHQAILAHDPAIDAPPARQPHCRRAGPSGAPGALGDRRLPAPPNRTVGREHELAAIGERLRASSVRLLTLTGPGGVGKTRLALEAARAVEADFADGAHFVSLAAVHDPRTFPAAIVRALGIVVLAGESAEPGGRTLPRRQAPAARRRQLRARARRRAVHRRPARRVSRADRARHQPRAARACRPRSATPSRRSRCPSSRHPRTRRRWRASTPSRCSPSAREPTIRTSSSATATPRRVAEICRRLDGLPLAIELAAARCGLLSPAEIAERLDAALGALGAGARDAPARQQTLRATIDWSHDLLSDDEKACFARFAVFAGGATVEAAETITGAEPRHARPPGRQEPARAPPAARTATPGWRCSRPIRAYASRALRGRRRRGGRPRAPLPPLPRVGPAPREPIGRSGERARKEHLARLDAEIDNLHAALAWAVEPGQRRTRPRAVRGARPVLADARPLRGARCDWIDQALSLPGADAHPALRVRVLCIKGWALWPLGRGAEQPAIMAEAEAIARALADPAAPLAACSRPAPTHEGPRRPARCRRDARRRGASAGRAPPATTGRSRWPPYARAHGCDSAAELRERVDRAASLLEAAGNVYQLAELLAVRRLRCAVRRQRSRRQRVRRRAIPIARELDSPYLLDAPARQLGLAALLTGDTDAARDAFRRGAQALPRARRPALRLRRPGRPRRGRRSRGDLDRAARLFGAAARASATASPTDAVEARLDATYFEPARRRPEPTHGTPRSTQALS